MLELDLTGILHEFLIEDPSPREPVSHARSSLTEHEQVKLRSDLLVVSFLCFLEPCKVSLELVLGRESEKIYSLQLIPLLIASPVSARDILDLECCAEELL